MAGQEEDLIAQFAGMTGASPEVATQYLENSSWDLSSAVTEFFNPPEDANPSSQAPTSGPSSSAAAGEPAPQPIPTSSKMPPAPSKSAPKKKFATLNDLASSSSAHDGPHSHDDDEDDNPDDDPNLYAGGEKSGLAVENPVSPEDLKRKIIERAKKNAQRPGGDDAQEPESHFTGTARTLGGDDAPSEVVPDPSANEPRRAQRVTRRLHFWANGFSVDDGPLYRLDDPRNAEILSHIKQGRAPMHILNVSHDQEVDVQLEQHSEKYVPPKKQYKPFEGAGQRLGSPTPGFESSSSSSAPAGAGTSSSNSTNAAQASSSASSSTPGVSVDESAPTISLQIRLGDGSRLSSRFNATHTVGDVYRYVDEASSAGNRPWVLMTTFPSKELTDRAQVLGDLPDFKRGGVVVQKWS